MAQPLLQAEIDINAPVSKVWELISDFRRMPQWSPQCRWMKPLGAVRPGTHTFNLNRRGRMFWPTTSVITEYVPERKLAFRVTANRSVWTYELEPTANGTRVIESRRAPDGISGLSTFATNKFMGGVDSFDQELIAGMNTSLRKIKAAAENG